MLNLAPVTNDVADDSLSILYLRCRNIDKLADIGLRAAKDFQFSI